MFCLSVLLPFRDPLCHHCAWFLLPLLVTASLQPKLPSTTRMEPNAILHLAVSV